MNDKTIYRCGWCGYPVSEYGTFLDDINTLQEADAYIEANSSAIVIQVNGECCPYGDDLSHLYQQSERRSE